MELVYVLSYTVLSRCAVLPQILPYDPDAPLGVPVTPFTAARGMLVRRGHDWRGVEGFGADEQVRPCVAPRARTWISGPLPKVGLRSP